MTHDATPVAHRDTRPASKLLRGSAASVGGQVLYLATRFLLTPYVVARVGLEGYGFWSVLFVVLGLLGVNRMGFSGAVVSLVARHAAEGRRDRMEAALATAGALAGIFALVVGGVLTVFADGIVRALGTSEALHASAVAAWIVTVWATFISLTFGGWQSVLEGLQEFPRVKLVDAAATALETVLVLVVLAAGGGLLGLAGAYAVRILAPVVAFAVLARRRVPGLRAGPGRIDRECARTIAGFGGKVQLVGLIQLGVATVERLTLSRMVSLAAAGAFEVSRKLVSFCAALPACGLAPLAPAAADLGARSGDRRALAPLVRRATRTVAVLAALPLAAIAVFAPHLLAAWIGRDDPAMAAAARVLAVSGLVHLATGPATAVLRGLAEPGLELLYSAVWLVLGAVLMPLGAQLGGMPGVAAGSAVSQAAASVLLLALALPRLGVRRRDIARELLGPAVACVLPAVLLALVAPAADPADRVATALTAAAAGAVAALAGGALCWRFVLDADDRGTVRARLAPLTRRLRAAPVAAPEVSL